MTAIFFLSFVIFIGYANIMSQGRIFLKAGFDQTWLTKKNILIQQDIQRLDAGVAPTWLSQLAPVIWWHSNEEFKSANAEEVFKTADLWFRALDSNRLTTELKINLGPIQSMDWRHFKFQDVSPAQPITRLFETGSPRNGLAGFELHFNPFEATKEKPYLMWRVGKHPIFNEVQTADSASMIVPVEFWYYMNFNPTGVWIGNHEGDWESFLFVVRLQVKDQHTIATPLLVATSAHTGSSWHCARELLKNTSGEFELFSALGTHATYISDGLHTKGLLPDRTERGSAWVTRDALAPLVSQNFYGFSGSWGRTSFAYYQSGPLPPGPEFKYIPTETNRAKAVQEFQQALKECEDGKI